GSNACSSGWPRVAHLRWWPDIRPLGILSEISLTDSPWNHPFSLRDWDRTKCWPSPARLRGSQLRSAQVLRALLLSGRRVTYGRYSLSCTRRTTIRTGSQLPSTKTWSERQLQSLPVESSRKLLLRRSAGLSMTWDSWCGEQPTWRPGSLSI